MSFKRLGFLRAKTGGSLKIAKTSNAHRNSAAHIQEKKSSYTAMPTARQKILSTSWNVQCVVFNTSEKLNNN
jgi:hypothetical protein